MAKFLSSRSIRSSRKLPICYSICLIFSSMFFGFFIARNFAVFFKGKNSEKIEKDIENLRKNFLDFPQLKRQSLEKRLNQTFYSQIGQDEIVDRLLNGKRNGFFFEAGAYDGQFLSNTLFFEEERQWTGLLIEANPKLYRTLKSRERNAYLSNSCLSPFSYAIQLNFTFADYLGGLQETNDKSMISGSQIVQCFPINIYFQALNIKHIDYFSLDIEGLEMEILKQIDFHQIRIDVLTIEYAIKYHRSPESIQNLQNIRELLLQTGLYHQVMTIQDLDVVFMRNPC